MGSRHPGEVVAHRGSWVMAHSETDHNGRTGIIKNYTVLGGSSSQSLVQSIKFYPSLVRTALPSSNQTLDTVHWEIDPPLSPSVYQSLARPAKKGTLPRNAQIGNLTAGLRAPHYS